MTGKNSDYSIDALCRANRTSAPEGRFETVLKWMMVIGVGALIVTILGGLLALNAATIRAWLKPVVAGAFLLGLGLVGLSWVFSFGVLVRELHAGSQGRFQRSHDLAASFAGEVADQFSKDEITSRLKAVRLELKLNARAPDKLPITVGIIATSAAAVRFIVSPEGELAVGAAANLKSAVEGGDPAGALGALATGLAPELAIIGFGVLLGSYIVRGMIHTDHDRLLRTESLLERAEAIARPPKKPVAVPSGPAT